jgi:hypothetical protein
MDIDTLAAHFYLKGSPGASNAPDHKMGLYVWPNNNYSCRPHKGGKSKGVMEDTIWGIWKEKAEFLTNPAFTNCLIFIKIP